LDVSGAGGATTIAAGRQNRVRHVGALPSAARRRGGHGVKTLLSGLAQILAGRDRLVAGCADAKVVYQLRVYRASWPATKT